MNQTDPMFVFIQIQANRKGHKLRNYQINLTKYQTKQLNSRIRIRKLPIKQLKYQINMPNNRPKQLNSRTNIHRCQINQLSNRIKQLKYRIKLPIKQLKYQINMPNN